MFETGDTVKYQGANAIVLEPKVDNEGQLWFIINVEGKTKKVKYQELE